MDEVVKKKRGNPKWVKGVPKKERNRLVNGDILPDGSVFMAKNPAQALKKNPRPRKGGQHAGGAKQRHTKVLLAYLSNADNPIIRRRQDYLKILGLSSGSPGYINNIFTRDELSEIEATGLANRRKAYAPRLAMIDDGLLTKASEGHAAEVKLAYQRFEGWSEKVITEVNSNVNISAKLDGEIRALLTPVYKGIIDVEPSGKTELLPESI